MIRPTSPLRTRFAARLEAQATSGVLEEFVAAHPDLEDAELAELIEVDGRWHLQRGARVELDRYLALIGETDGHPISIDAAVDMDLRSHGDRNGRPTAESIESLVQKHPELRQQIVTAAQLGMTLWSTASLVAEGPRSPIPVPSSFGPMMEDGRRRYELLRIAGSGSWAFTYVAVDRHFHDPESPALVAIKVFAGLDESDVARALFSDEATKARRVIHENVVRVLEHGVDDSNRPFIVFDYVPGGDLSELLRRNGGPLDPGTAAELVAKVANGVQAIHSSGLVHCDLKPTNVLLDETGEPTIVDLGIAQRARGKPDERLDTGGSTAAGTPAFMAPEQYRAEETAFDPPIDIYALGHLLYWLLTGRLANGETHEELAAALGDEGAQRQVSVRSVNSNVDRDLERICARAMSWSPTDRYFSPGELAGDLERWRAREPITWTRPSPARRALLLVRRRPIPVVLGTSLIAMALAALVIGAALKLRADRSARDLRLREEIDLELRSSIVPFLAGLRVRRWDGRLGQNFWSIWFAEWMYGPKLYGTPETINALLNEKILVASRQVLRLVADGKGDSLERHLWDTLRALWLVEAGEFEESKRAIDSSRRFWEAHLNADDPWFYLVDTIEVARKFDELTTDPEFDLEQSRAELMLRVEALEELLARIDDDVGDAKPMVSFIHERLRTAYGESMLNLPDRLSALDTSRELPPSDF